MFQNETVKAVMTETFLTGMRSGVSRHEIEVFDSQA